MNLCSFYFDKLIGKLTSALHLQQFSLRNMSVSVLKQDGPLYQDGNRPGTKIEIIIVTINAKENSEDDKFSAIGCNISILIYFTFSTHFCQGFSLGF